MTATATEIDVDGPPTEEIDCDQHARDTHAKVLAGELDWETVYGSDGFAPDFW